MAQLSVRSVGAVAVTAALALLLAITLVPNAVSAQEVQRAPDEQQRPADPAGHRWEIVTTEDTGDPGCRNWRVVPRFGPLGAIMGWWRVKVSSGCPLPAPLAAADARGRLTDRWSEP
jgi:hypothetical protein